MSSSAVATEDGVRAGVTRWRAGIVLLLSTVVVFAAVRFGLDRYQTLQYAGVANRAKDAKDWKRLSYVAQQWLGHEPDSAEALFFAGEAADELGDFSQAAEFLRQVPEPHSLFADALARLTVLYIGPLNRPDLVEPSLIRLTQTAADSSIWSRELLRHYGMTAQRTKSIRHARETILHSKSAPGAAYVYLMAPDLVLYSAAEDLNAYWMTAGGDSELYRVAKLVNHARSIGLGDSGEEIVENEEREQELAAQEQALLACLSDYPQNIELLSLLIAMHADRGDVDGAAELLARVPSSAAEDARFYRYKGWVHRMRDQYALAEAAFGQAITKDRYDWRSRHQLAEVLRLDNRPDEAAASLEIATHGSTLRKAIIRLKGLDEIPADIFVLMQRNAQAVGDTEIAERLGDVTNRP